MRIAILSREFPPETGWGGIGTYAYHLAHALAGLGHGVHVISRSERLEEYSRQDGPVTVHRIREWKWRGPGSDFLYRYLPLSEWWYSRRVAEKIRELHRQQPFDVIEAAEYRAEAFHVARRAPAPVLLKLHSPTFVLDPFAGGRPSRLREWLADRMESATARRAAGLCTPSRALGDTVAQAWGIPRERIERIPNPLPATGEAPAWPDAGSPPTVLFAGRFDARKGLAVLGPALIGVLQAIPNAQGILVGAPGDASVLGGDADLSREVAERWRQAGVLDRIRLVPWQKDPAALREYYGQSHLVVVPSLWENFPNAVLEGMAAGRAVVASRVGGIPEMITPERDGLLVNPGDVSGLEAALIRLLQDLPAARRLGQAARARVTDACNARTVAEQTAAWYEQVRRAERIGGRAARVLAIVTHRWINWEKDDGVAIMVPEWLRGLERQGLRARLIRRPYRPGQPPRWGRFGALSGLREWLELAWDLTEPVRNLAFVMRRWLSQPFAFELIWEYYSLYGLSGWALSWVTGRPLALNVDAPLIEESEQLHHVRLGRARRAMARWVLRRTLSRAAVIHVPSTVLADWLVRRCGVSRAKVHVIPNGVHLTAQQDSTDREALRRRHGVGAAPLIVFVGSLQPWHGCEVLVQAFDAVRQRCPEARLFIVGDGQVRRALEIQASNLRLNGSVHFVGQIPHAQVPEFLQMADVAVLPYPHLPVPFYFSPIKLFEYMGAGKAIVASRAGQIAEVLRDGDTGRLVTPGSSAELAETLVQVLTSSDRGAALGARAREAAAHHTWEQRGDALGRLCRAALEQRHG